MKKKDSIVTSIIFVMLLSLSGFSQQVFVSPQGDDSNNGTSQSTPVKSFQRAADVAKSLGSTDIVVEFADGEYLFENTVQLDASYSGITFQAAAGANPVFTSLKRVSEWAVHSGNIMVANLPDGISSIRYLQDKSETWLKRSSTSFFRPDFIAPCGGAECEHWEPGEPQLRKSYTTFPASFNFPDPDKIAQYDLRVSMTAWHAQVLPLTSINTSTRRINVGTPSHYSIVNGIDDLLSECWVLNSIEGINEPGEWACIDGKVYLYPKSGTDDIYAPDLQELIRIDAGGDGNLWQGTPVQNISFTGFTFTGTNYRITETNDIMAQHDWQMVDVDEGMLRFRNASNCTVKNCIFTKGGCDGVRLDRYAQNITIDGCTFTYLGKGGVLLSGRGPGYGDVNKNNSVINCHFKQTSRIKWDAAAVHIDQSSNNFIKQNYFEDIPLSAIIMSGCRESNLYEAQADPLPVNRDFHFLEVRPDLIENPDGAAIEFYEHNNLIEENTFRAVHIGVPELIPAVTIDAPGFTNGMIYTTGRKTGETSTIRKNYFYDVDPQLTFSQSWVILGDGFEDYLDFHQNMGYNLIEINGFEDPPFFSNNCSQPNGCAAYANAKLNSPFSVFECSYCENPSYSGNIDFDNSSPSGSAAHLNEYIEMWLLLCSGVLPGPSTLPGSEAFQTQLGNKILEFGGTLPDCDPTSISSEMEDPSNLVSIFPNPARNILYIRNESGESITSVDIISTTGQKIKSIRGGSELSSVDISDLPPGFYLIHLRSDRLNFTYKFIKK